MVSAMTSTSTREGEQGDPFMPLLLSLVVHDVLATVKAGMFAGESSICVVPGPDRVREVYNTLAAAFHNRAGVQLHTGKTRVWNSVGAPFRFIDALTRERLQEERRFWEALL